MSWPVCSLLIAILEVFLLKPRVQRFQRFLLRATKQPGMMFSYCYLALPDSNRQCSNDVGSLRSLHRPSRPVHTPRRVIIGPNPVPNNERT